MKKQMLWIIFAALFLLTACGALAAGELVLPDPEDLESVTITAGELEWTTDGGDFIARLVELLKESAKGDAGRASVQDAPEGDSVRIDFGFRRGGKSTLFLCREGEGLLLEQPYQGIYLMDGALEEQIRRQIALELSRGQTMKQE